MNKIYIDQTAFLKIDDPQSLACPPCQFTLRYVSCLFEHAFSGRVEYCMCSTHYKLLFTEVLQVTTVTCAVRQTQQAISLNIT